MTPASVGSDLVLDDAELRKLNAYYASRAPEALLNWAVRQLGTNLRFACSFSAEDMAILEIIFKRSFPIHTFYLDTGRLHQATYDLIERSRKRYGMEIEAFHPKAESVQDLLTKKGPNSFYLSVENRKECCFIRKVEPLGRALEGCRAWVTGQRREQSVTRRKLEKIERDEAHPGILKLNPLADWSEEKTWKYIHDHDVPYNALHDQGFPSIGCEPCTRAVQPGEDRRAGRWWWEEPEHKECGLHNRAQDRLK